MQGQLSYQLSATSQVEDAQAHSLHAEALPRPGSQSTPGSGETLRTDSCGLWYTFTLRYYAFLFCFPGNESRQAPGRETPPPPDPSRHTPCPTGRGGTQKAKASAFFPFSVRVMWFPHLLSSISIIGEASIYSPPYHQPLNQGKF